MSLRKMAIPFKNFLKNTIISSSQMNDNLSEIEYCHNNLHEEVSTVKSTTYTKTESDKLLNNLDTKLVTTKGNLEASILNNVNTLNSKIDTTKNELNSTINSVNTTLDSKINSVNTTLDSKINANKNELDSKINANHKDAKSYSDSNKASLIDNAPVNLNTLNKISNAIGNDANFSTNTKNSIDKKANSDDVYTKNEVYTKKEIDLKMDNIETVTRSSGISPSCVKIVTPGEWIEEDGVYFVNLKHNLLASRVLVSMIDLDTGESILPTFKVIDGGNITVISNYACNASVSILNANIRTEEVNFAQIDDEVVSKYGTWSSEKIDNELSALELVASNIKMSDDSSVEDVINTNKTSISSLQTKVNGLFNDNVKNAEPKNFHISSSEIYFNDTSIDRDLNNIRQNLYTQTTSANGLKNLPTGKGGGAGFLEVVQTYKSGNKLSHTIQKFTDTAKNETYIRTYNEDNGTWTDWKEHQSHKLTNNKGQIDVTYNGDFNNLTKTGWYYITSPTNSPASGGAWYLEVMSRDGGYVYQRATRNENGNNNLAKYERTMHNNTWTAWREL